MLNNYPSVRPHRGHCSPDRAATFRWTSMTVLALSSACFTHPLEIALESRDLVSKPVLGCLAAAVLGLSPASSPSSRSRRHAVRYDE